MYDEKRDVHPVFCYNPFLIEEEAIIIEYEHVIPGGQIDFLLRDKKGLKLFVEVKWSYVDKRQILDYVTSIKNSEKDKNYRVMWLVPDDLKDAIPDYVLQSLRKDRAEIKFFSRNKIIMFIKLREKASNSIKKIVSLLSTPYKVKIEKEFIQFASPMEACYFDGKVVATGKRVGLKKTATGWYLDLLKCVLLSQYTSQLPDVTLEFLKELLDAPYYYRRLGHGKGIAYVDTAGFGNFITKWKRGKYKGLGSLSILPIIDIVQQIRDIVDEFHTAFTSVRKELYNDDRSKYDLAVRYFENFIAESTQSGIVMADKLLLSIIEHFQLRPSTPIPSLTHSTVGEIVSSVKSGERYENNMGKRIVELFCLKYMLFPSRAIYGAFEILMPKLIGKQEVFERIRTQSFIINREKGMYVNRYVIHEGAK
ncbi:MAG: hypothetical protein L6408_07155 [Nanoarchaeota archaeon]|nr:hypothetical protein [Nanoarchaeota archaeon]